MIPLKNIRHSLLLLLTTTSLSAETISISAAASLAPSLEKVATEFKLRNPGDSLIFNYASSSVLARQIQYGATANLYLSANRKWIDFLNTQQKLEKQSVRPFLVNQLVIAKAANDKRNRINQSCFNQSSTINLIKGLAEQSDHILVADMTHVPLGIYSKQAINSSGTLSQLKSKLIPTANARSALAFVEQGQADYAFLYYSDAVNSNKVEVICIIPSDFHDPINYYLAKVIPLKQPNESKISLTQRFYDFLQTKPAKEIFVKQGFLEN